MSKAFTKESDAEENVVLPVRSPLPSGVKNYITAAGADKLRAELQSLETSSGSSGAFREARIRQLREIIPTLVVAPPPAEPDVIRFGARVEIRRGSITEAFRLVGVDETDLDHNEISWLSPLGKALLGKRAGDRLRFRSPAGMEELVILSLSYP